MSTEKKLWLTPSEATEFIGGTEDAIWRDIRENQFPFEYVRRGRRIFISAKSLGLVPRIEKEKAQNQEEVLANAA